MSVTERTFSYEITKTLKDLGYFTLKIPDAHPMQDPRTGKMVRFNTQKKPFDRILDLDGKFIGIEEKIAKTGTFSLYQLRNKQAHQIDNLCDRKHGWFFINYRYKDKEGKRINKMVILKAKAMRAAIKQGYKSIRLDFFEQKKYKHVYARSKGVWDFPIELLKEETT